jgi:hypothetical protein
VTDRALGDPRREWDLRQAFLTEYGEELDGEELSFGASPGGWAPAGLAAFWLGVGAARRELGYSEEVGSRETVS